MCGRLQSITTNTTFWPWTVVFFGFDVSLYIFSKTTFVPPVPIDSSQELQIENWFFEFFLLVEQQSRFWSTYVLTVCQDFRVAVPWLLPGAWGVPYTLNPSTLLIGMVSERIMHIHVGWIFPLVHMYDPFAFTHICAFLCAHQYTPIYQHIHPPSNGHSSLSNYSYAAAYKSLVPKPLLIWPPIYDIINQCMA